MKLISLRTVNTAHAFSTDGGEYCSQRDKNWGGGESILTLHVAMAVALQSATFYFLVFRLSLI